MGLQDKIGREDFVNKICGLVDSLGKDKNFSMAINGAWGSGKSFVLDMIEEKLSERQEYIVIKYDAWENNFYPDPLIAILYCILDSLTSNPEFKKFQKDKTLKKRVKKVFSQSFDEAIDKTIDKLYKIGSWAGVVAYTAETIKSIIKVAKISILDNKLFDDFKSYKKLLQDFINVSNKLTEYEKEEGKQTKLIILVDEVDRCLPDEQLKVLERLHHLFKVNNCAVIVAMNCECVSKTVKKIYDMDGSEYLRKFFSLTYKLDTKADIYLLNLMGNIEENVKKFNPNYKEYYNIVLVSRGFILAAQEALKLSNTINNREIKEFYECVEKICDEFGWENIKCDSNLFFIILGTYIKRVVDPNFMNTYIGNSDPNGAAIDYIGDKLQIKDDETIKILGGIHVFTDIDRRREYFNDMVHCATYDLDAGSQYMDRKYQTTFSVAECKKLKELILKHAGEKYVDTRETN